MYSGPAILERDYQEHINLPCSCVYTKSLKSRVFLQSWRGITSATIDLYPAIQNKLSSQHNMALILYLESHSVQEDFVAGQSNMLSPSEPETIKQPTNSL